MPSPAGPLLTLGSLIMAALLVAAAGVGLSRREHEVREVGHRAETQALGAALGTELARLDDLYEQNLRDLAQSIDLANTVDAQQACKGLVGIRLCTLLRGPPQDDPVHLYIDSPPETTAVSLKPLLGKHILVLPFQKVFPSNSEEPDQGWETVPGSRESVFWVRKFRRAAVAFTISSSEVCQTNSSHIANWLEPQLASFKSRGEVLRVEAPEAGAVAGTEDKTAARPADFVAIFTTRWGSWQLQAWDRFTLQTHYSLPVLMAAFTLSATLVLLGAILYRAQKRAHAIAEQRVTFVNRVSHELATPLTNMLLNLDLAQDLIATAPDEATRRLRLVAEETRRLARLTENVLAFSRRDRGTAPAPRAAVPDEVVARVLEHFAPALQRRTMVVERDLHAPDWVMVDSDALAQITANLVSNAEKFAAEGRWLRVATTLEDGHLSMKIGDRGPGIPRLHQERMFKPFERLTDQVNEGASGTGLGLAIARDLARRMGGDLQVVNGAGQRGLELELRIPVAICHSGDVHSAL